MNKLLCISLLFFLISSCSNYNHQEISALQDITNEYLNKEGKRFFLRMYRDKSILDTLTIKVYISDVLKSISQAKEDDYWVFDDTLSNRKNDSIFIAIQNSKRFKSLGYLEIRGDDLKLDSKYTLIDNPTLDLNKNDKGYIEFRYSRICFNDNFKYGIVFLKFGTIYNSKGGMGEVKVLFIMKEKNKWKIIEKT